MDGIGLHFFERFSPSIIISSSPTHRPWPSPDLRGDVLAASLGHTKAPVVGLAEFGARICNESWD